jgi:hypothetical protein
MGRFYCCTEKKSLPRGIFEKKKSIENESKNSAWLRVKHCPRQF